MNYFNMSYNEVIQSPMQRLILLSKSIPKYEKKKPESKKSGILDFAKENNLLKKKK